VRECLGVAHCTEFAPNRSEDFSKKPRNLLIFQKIKVGRDGIEFDTI